LQYCIYSSQRIQTTLQLKKYIKYSLIRFFSCVFTHSHAQILTQNFDGVTPPALPTGWSTSTDPLCPGCDVWNTSNSNPNSSPNSANLTISVGVLNASLESSSFNTTGLTNITVTWQATTTLSSDNTIIEYAIGTKTTWIQVSFTGSANSTYSQQSVVLPGAVDNRSTVFVRWRIPSASTGNTFDIDDVQITGTVSMGTTFYSLSSASTNLDDLSSWSTDVNEVGGSQPTTFTNVNDEFIVNDAGSTFDNDWPSSGSIASLVIETGADLTAPDLVAFDATVDVNSGALLILENSSTPDFGFVDANSTIEFAHTSASLIPAMTYGNVTIRNGTRVIEDENATINGTLNLVSGSLKLSEDPTKIMRFRGNVISTTGVIRGSEDSNLELLGTVSVDELRFSSNPDIRVLRNFTINKTGGATVTLDGVLRVANQFNFTSGTFDLDDGTLVLSGVVVYTAGQITATNGSTASYVLNSDFQVVIPGTYNNLTFSDFPKSFPNASIVNINNTFTPGLGSGHNLNNSTIRFTGNGQTVPEFEYFNLEIAGNNNTSESTLSVSNDLTNDGTFTAPSGTLSLSGDLINNATFNHNSGTVDFEGTSSITGMVPQLSNVTISGTLNAPSTLSLTGDFTNNGTFNEGTGTVVFEGSSGTQSIAGSSITNFNDIDANNDISVDTEHSIAGVLTLGASVTFDADGSSDMGTFTLLSTADDGSGDARIAAIPSSSSVDGDVTVERFMSGEGRVWRYIAPPVSGEDVAGWQDDFDIAGSFTGSDPGFSASLFRYDETDAGDLNIGWEEWPPSGTDNTQLLDNGRGYAAFINEGGFEVTIDSRGTISQQDQVFSPDYSGPGGLTTNDGWNLLGNPYPSAVSWDGISITTAIEDIVRIRDNAGSGMVLFYDGSIASTFNGEIATGQSFWIQTNNSGGSLTISESSKVSDAEFFETPTQVPNEIVVSLSDGEKKDVTIIRLKNEATEGLDSHIDAVKLDNEIFNIATVLNEETNMLINSLPFSGCFYEVDLNVYNTEPGEYSLDFSKMETFEFDHTFTLIDNFADEIINILEKPNYPFTITNDPETYGATRFSLILEGEISNISDVSSPSSACIGETINVLLSNPQPGVSYQVQNSGQVVSNTAVGSQTATLSLTIEPGTLPEGVNELNIRAFREGCESVTLDLPVIEIGGAEIEIVETSSTSVCEGESATISAVGSSETASYRWYESLGAETPIEGISNNEFTTPEITTSISYFVSAVNATGCESERMEIMAEVLPEFLAVTEDVSGCGGESLTLVASGAPEGGTYLWYGSEEATEPLATATDGIFTTTALTSSQTFFVAIRSESGCEGPRNEVAAEIVNLETPIIEQEGNVLISSSETGNQWFFNGEPIEGAIDKTLEVSGSGEYFVRVSAGDDCSTSSNTRVVTITGIEDEHSEIGLRVYPNPSSNIVFVEFYSKVQKAKLDIITAAGNIVLKESLQGQNGIFKTEIDISHINAGLYILRVHEGSKMRYRRLVKN